MTAARVHVPIRDDSDVVVARRHLRDLGAEVGMSTVALEELAIALTEIARNVVVHAHAFGGEVTIETAPAPTERRLVVTVRDAGPGIADVERALSDGFSTGTGLGLGLPGARRLVDELEIVSAPGEGTRIVLTKYVRKDPR